MTNALTCENILMKSLQLAAHCSDHITQMSVVELAASFTSFGMLRHPMIITLGNAKLQIPPRPTESETLRIRLSTL